MHKAVEYIFCAQNTKVPTPRVSVQIKLEKPPSNWYKLNIDGASLGNPSVAGGRGVIRNEESHWIWGFSKNIDITTVRDILAH